MNMRKLEEKIFRTLMYVSLTIVTGSLIWVFAIVAIRGAGALNIEMVTQIPHGGYYLGGGGGILNAIIGSLYLSVGAIIIALAISLPIAWYLNQYTGRSAFASFVRSSLDISTGIPPVVYGVFVFLIMIELQARASLLWGTITVAIFITPILTRGMDEVMQMVPVKLREASLAMGTTELESLVYVITRQALPGVITAIILAFGRGIGNASAVLFTAGYTDTVPTSPGDPVATLPLSIFFQLSSPILEVQQRAYASGIILLTIVLVLTIASRALSKKFMKYVIR